jgi:hypothetical protein
MGLCYGSNQFVFHNVTFILDKNDRYFLMNKSSKNIIPSIEDGTLDSNIS